MNGGRSVPAATDVRIVDVRCDLEETPFRMPLKFGGRVVDGSKVINVHATVETLAGRRAEGHGAMPVGNVWGWPTTRIEPTLTEQAVCRTAEGIVRKAADCRETGHPLDLLTSIEPEYQATADAVTAALGLTERMPKLMTLVAASPLDAAVHDAYGKVHERNIYHLYGREFVTRDLAHFLTPEFRGEFLDRYVSREPKALMPLYHLVGALDPLTKADVVKPVADGLPETLAEWIVADGLTHLKIKLAGDNLAWDVARVASVEAVVAETTARLGRDRWYYSADFNEKCKDVEYVLDFLARVGEQSPSALARIQYIEQPTARDLRANPANKMHRAAAIRPVVIDESLTDLESLQLAVEQGYSGVALKTCKGHGQALLLGAYAQQHGLFLCVQDLTCPGASFLHSAGLAARLPGVAAVEGNARQFCPAANRAWLARYPDLFHVRGGSVRTGLLNGPGLGY
jgi:L-alanine-DL-glutamate epimerase-like enolase superfamily enzyme